MLSHGEGNGTRNKKAVRIERDHYFDLPLVKSLVSGNGHFDLVTDTQEEDTSLWLSQSNLTDDLIETLGEEFFSDGANTALTGLTLHQFLIKSLSEAGNIHSRGLLVADILNEVLA